MIRGISRISRHASIPAFPISEVLRFQTILFAKHDVVCFLHYFWTISCSKVKNNGFLKALYISTSATRHTKDHTFAFWESDSFNLLARGEMLLLLPNFVPFLPVF